MDPRPGGGAPANASPMTALLEVRNLRKSFAGVHAVDGISLAVHAGSITGLIGPNGSGKTTTIDCISGFQRIDGGTVMLAGADVTGRPAHHIARAGLMRTFQTVQLYENLTLVDNLLIAAQQFDPAGFVDEFFRTRRYRAAHASGAARARELIELIGLTRLAEAEASIFSYGQKKLIALAAALMSRPKLVVLDEPVAGVNPTRIREVEAILRRLNAAGETFLIVEHNVEFITNLSDRIIVLDQGRKLADGTAAEIHDDPRVLEAYLGVTPEVATELQVAS
jgi:ABC-type branched-subunit amino acid transport system ATPase component